MTDDEDIVGMVSATCKLYTIAIMDEILSELLRIKAKYIKEFSNDPKFALLIKATEVQNERTGNNNPVGC